MPCELCSAWSFWYHPSKSKDWSRESYIFISKVTTAEELWGILNEIQENQLKNGMYFLMRNDIFPDWSDIENMEGGYWSLKVTEPYKKTWHTWIVYMVAEEIADILQGSYAIHGISISPKLNHTILKVWNDDSRYCKTSLLHKDLNPSLCKYFAFDTK